MANISSYISLFFSIISNAIQNKRLNKPQLHLDQKGQGLVEYALILVLVAVVVIAILTFLGPAIGSVFSGVIDGLSGAVQGPDQDPGDYCVDYYNSTWHYVWRYNGGGAASDVSNWTRVAEPGGSMPLCAWSGPNNGSR